MSLVAGHLAARLALGRLHDSVAAVRSVASSHGHRRVPLRGDTDIDAIATVINDVLDELDSEQRRHHQVVADASHELRTPLAALRANVEVLERGQPGTDDASEIIADVSRQARRLTSLVDDLIDLSRDWDAADVPDGLFAIDDVVTAAVDRARLFAGEVTISMDTEPHPVRGDAWLSGRALANVLDNAVAWAGPGGTVAVRQTGPTVVVTDSGPGFDNSELDRVFDRFFRGRATQHLPGSGLGLAFVLKAVEAQGGMVHARNGRAGGAEVELIFVAPSKLSESTQYVLGNYADSGVNPSPTKDTIMSTEDPQHESPRDEARTVDVPSIRSTRRRRLVQTIPLAFFSVAAIGLIYLIWDEVATSQPNFRGYGSEEPGFWLTCLSFLVACVLARRRYRRTLTSAGIAVGVATTAMIAGLLVFVGPPDTWNGGLANPNDPALQIPDVVAGRGYQLGRGPALTLRQRTRSGLDVASVEAGVAPSTSRLVPVAPGTPIAQLVAEGERLRVDIERSRRGPLEVTATPGVACGERRMLVETTVEERGLTGEEREILDRSPKPRDLGEPETWTVRDTSSSRYLELGVGDLAPGDTISLTVNGGGTPDTCADLIHPTRLNIYLAGGEKYASDCKRQPGDGPDPSTGIELDSGTDACRRLARRLAQGSVVATVRGSDAERVARAYHSCMRDFGLDDIGPPRKHSGDVYSVGLGLAAYTRPYLTATDNGGCYYRLNRTETTISEPILGAVAADSLASAGAAPSDPAATVIPESAEDPFLAPPSQLR